jgi:HD-GYP domain-containing protein (c-di-GMP phosphodiesterase class II)
MVLETVPPVSDKVRSMILPDHQIQNIVWRYAQNIALMVSVIVVVVVGGLYYVVRYWFINPIRTAVKSNRATREGSIEMIPPEAIPNDELGVLMDSRNRMLEAIQTLYSEDALETLCRAVDAKDEYTEGHSRRVGQLGSVLGEYTGLDDEVCERIHYSGTLHDIGKIGVPDRILNKPGSLTDEEYEVVKEHPRRGGDIIQFSNIDEDVVAGIRYHHEEYDGSGYPEGLEGEEIPLFGRILAVADAVDAMLSNRSYRDPLPDKVVREELEDGAGQQFDPEVAEAGLELLEPVDVEDQDFLEDVLPELCSTTGRI